MPTSLPPEIWIRILSFLPDSDIAKLYGVNLLFYELAMDCRYSDLSLYDYPAFERIKARLSTTGPTGWQKRIKSVSIVNVLPHPCITSTENLTSNTSEPSSRFRRQVSLVSSAIRRWTGTSTTRASPSSSRTPAPTELVRDCILDILGGAENLQELTICGPWSREYKQYILRPLYSVLSKRPSLRKLNVESDKLWVVLPFMEFRRLEEVNVHIRPQSLSELAPSMGAFSGFLKHVAPSVQVLIISAWIRDPAIHDISRILCNDALIMPNLRELSAPLMFPAVTMDTINSKFSALTKLDLTLCAPTDSLATSLRNLRLPQLRILWLTIRESDYTTGVWDGSSSELRQLEDIRVWGRHTTPVNVAQLCRFFSASRIVRLLLKVAKLDGPLIDMLAASFPDLRDLHLQARSLLSRGTILPVHVILFQAQMEDRCYPEWRLSRVVVSLYLPYVSRCIDADKTSKRVTSSLVRSIPSVEIGDSSSTEPLYHV